MIRDTYNFQDLVDAAKEHYENVKADINNASTRTEHVRLTALAQEAENLYISLRVFNAGLVYTHVATGGIGPMHE